VTGAGEQWLLEAELARQVKEEAERPHGAVSANGLREQIADLDAKLSQGAERLLAAPRDLTATLTAKLREWQSKRDDLAALLAAQDKHQPPDAKQNKANGRQGLAKLQTLQEAFCTADPALQRELIRQAIVRIECSFSRVSLGTRGRTKSVFRRGMIHLRPDLISFKEVPRGLPLHPEWPGTLDSKERRQEEAGQGLAGHWWSFGEKDGVGWAKLVAGAISADFRRPEPVPEPSHGPLTCRTGGWLRYAIQRASSKSPKASLGLTPHAVAQATNSVTSTRRFAVSQL
jgi:hypothetical protein